MVAIIYGFSMHNKHLASFLKGGGLIRSEIYSQTKKFLIRICSKSKGGGGGGWGVRVVVPLTSVLMFYKRQKGLLREKFSLTIHTIKIRKGDIVD